MDHHERGAISGRKSVKGYANGNVHLTLKEKNLSELEKGAAFSCAPLRLYASSFFNIETFSSQSNESSAIDSVTGEIFIQTQSRSQWQLVVFE